MQTSNVQVSELVEAVHSQTMSGQLKWTSSAESGRFQARIGDYVIHVGGSMIPNLQTYSMRPGWMDSYADYIELVVTRVDGQVIQAAGGPYTLSMTQDRTNLSPQDKQKLARVYERISGTNPELDDLLKLLRQNAKG